MGELAGGLGGYTLARPALPTVPGDLFLAGATAGVTDRAVNSLAYAEDASNTPTVIPTDGSNALIIGVAITVPASGAPVTLRYHGHAQITAAGAGSLFLALYEFTGVGGVLLHSVGLGGSFTAGTGSKFASFPLGLLPIGPTTVERQFNLACSMIRDAASNLAASVRSSNAAGVPRAYLEAVTA